MRKITVTFNSSGRIQKLKKIMKGVYTSNLNDGSKLVKFNLKKTFIPAKVEEVQIEIKKIVGGNTIVTIPKTSLTFLSTIAPFNIIDAGCETEGNYIVLPWNISTASGKDELKSLINKISTSTTSLKYTVNLNSDEGVNPSSDTISHAELSLSENSFEDNTEELFNRIQELEHKVKLVNQNLNNATAETTKQQNIVTQKNQQITSLSNQVSNLNNQIHQKQGEILALNSQLINSSSNINYYSKSSTDYRLKYEQECKARQLLESITGSKKRGYILGSVYSSEFIILTGYCWTGEACIRHANGGTSGQMKLIIRDTKDNWA